MRINNKTFKVVQLNINGCSNATIQALNKYINDLQADFVMLSESKTYTLNNQMFDNYQVLLKPNKINPTRKGGVAILSHNYFTVNHLHQFEESDTDALFVTTKVGQNRFLLASDYNPPNEI